MRHQLCNQCEEQDKIAQNMILWKMPDQSHKKNFVQCFDKNDNLKPFKGIANLFSCDS